MKNQNKDRLKTLLAFLILTMLTAACTASQADSGPVEASTPPATIDPLYKSNGGGEPRSLGYWLIWNTCAADNQSETAKINGGWEAGWILMDDLIADPGILIGTLQLETCQQGLNLLQSKNMQNIDMKNDVAYTLAAQLFGAQLNLATGSEYCPALDQVIYEAQMLLLELNFDGTGGYLSPPQAGQNREKAEAALEQLTSYNTGELCR